MTLYAQCANKNPAGTYLQFLRAGLRQELLYDDIVILLGTGLRVSEAVLGLTK